MSDTRPIGVFDSGIGGVSVLREIARRLPSEDLVYFADSANVPYGNRIVPMPLPDARLELYLYWHANADADPAAIWLRGQVQALMAGA